MLSFPVTKSMLYRPKRPDRIIREVNESRYGSRGWIFQERLLSRRCLLFLEGQVYFQCQSQLYCEEPPYISAPVAASRELLNMTLNKLSRIASIQSPEDAFILYAELVCEYSWKDFSFPEDVLDAFAGILSVFETRFGWKFVYGIPIEPSVMFERALLWTPYRNQERLSCHDQRQRDTFPTWSWAGWRGAIDFWPALNPRSIHSLGEQPRLKSLTSRITELRICPQDGATAHRTMVPQIKNTEEVQ
jgi:hypothetical protein